MDQQKAACRHQSTHWSAGTGWCPRNLLWVFLLFALHPSTAQVARETVTQPVSWASYTANLETGKKTVLFVDTQFRYVAAPQTDMALEPMQYLFRGHLDIKLGKGLSFAPLGAALILNYRYGKQPVTVPNNEYRLYQQLMYGHKAGRLILNHRLRTEERFIEEHDPVTGASTGYTNRQFRPRYRFMATLPLTKNEDSPVKFSAQFFYEGFLSRGKKVTFQDIDQNRFFAGLTCQPVASLTIGLGWYYQMLIKSNGARQENNVGTLLMVTHNLSLVK